MKSFKFNTGIAIILWIGCTFLACENITDEDPTIAKIVVSNPFFTLLEAAAVKSDLALALSSANPNDENGNYTIFAPTDDAFARLNFTHEASLAALNNGFLRNTLLFHVADGIISGEELKSATHIGIEKKLIRRGDDLYINGSKILFTDAQSINGAFHGIDKILLATGLNMTASVLALSQGEVFSTPEMTFLLEAVNYTGLGDFLANTEGLTVFAPTDEAFKALGLDNPNDIRNLSKEDVEAILSNHIVQDGGKFTSEQDNLVQTTLGGGVIEYTKVDNGYFWVKSKGNNRNTQMLVPDIKTSNGVVHIVDQVLLP